MIVNGQEPMSGELSDDARAQLALRYDLAVQAGKSYSDAGYTVVFQDIILGPSLAEVAAKFDGYPLSLVVLCPDEETIYRRESGRGKSGYKNRTEIAAFERVLLDQTAHIGTWVDSSSLSVSQTVDQIVAATDGDPA